jgi:hypothetical protein
MEYAQIAHSRKGRGRERPRHTGLDKKRIVLYLLFVLKVTIWQS